MKTDVESAGNQADAFVRREHPANRTFDAVKVLLLTLITVLLVTVPNTFRGERWNASLTNFPVCNPETIHLPNFFPSALRPLVSCQSLVLGLALLVSAFWFCACDILGQARWKERYTGRILLTTLATIVVELFRSGDMASIFTQVVPIQVDICVLLCLTWDYVRWG